MFCSCKDSRYLDGNGNVRTFIMTHAVGFGGRTVNTNDLPAIDGDWQFIRSNYGVTILLPGSEYQRVEDFVKAAFGDSPQDRSVFIHTYETGQNTRVYISPLENKNK